MFRQAGITEIRNTLERKLTTADVQRLQLKYEDEGTLPAAAIVRLEGVELRLEKDYFDGGWTIATNEGEPRLLLRMDEKDLGSMLLAIDQSIEQLRS